MSREEWEVSEAAEYEEWEITCGETDENGYYPGQPITHTDPLIPTYGPGYIPF